MQYLLEVSPSEAVAAGAQLLDERMPGWWKRVSLEELELASCDRCVCGQLAADAIVQTSTPADMAFLNAYARTIYYLNLGWSSREEETELGFDHHFGFNVMDFSECADSLTVDQWCDLTAPTYDALEHEWKLVIRARLEADQLDRAPVVEALATAPVVATEVLTPA